MPSDTEIRASISEALNGLATAPILSASRRVFEALGYRSERRPSLPDSKPSTFLQNFDGQQSFNAERGMVEAWKSADFLCQVTDEEIQLARKNQPSLLADGKIEKGNARSFAFLSIGLNEDNYTRAQYSGITREINRMFNMPAICLFKNNGAVTLSVIDRRQHKKESAKDVLEKVTLIKDIEYKNPHRGHVDILSDLALPNLAEKFPPLENFDHLLRAWRETLDISTLNKRFYRELSNWYFWALPQVRFPADLESNDEKLRATSLIRLLTRLIFCWFLKEKSLIPDKLFRASDLANILKGFDPESETSSTYYLAILQNLFFATLNQRMDKDSNGNPYRAFAKDEGFQKNRSTYDVNNLYRYEALFEEGPEAALALFADIPFLNGGLFECLDRTEDGTDKKLYLDGFSRNPKKRPHVPDRLFFDSGEVADLSDVYDDKKRKSERVTGLINILDRYKFTIVENTPIDEEVALDPELLGKVFENLLASYNEETKTTARKQTGSFYTPRPIVDYMVDESLKTHLTKALVEKNKMNEDEAESKLSSLFAYTENEHGFTPAEVATLITSINEVKILDPACGSGAFPMGVLHKLVYILGKLDPDNERWKQTQLAKLDSAPMREELERTFAENNDDYGRKLCLIENCLYGVDIQPIAIQITKLRFFISLICDQKTNSDKSKNRNIKPLPNLETKFVAANSLIGLSEIESDSLVDPKVGNIEKEIESLYHNYFSIQRRDQKLSLQRKIKALRHELGKLLAESLMAPKKAQLIAEWDPFDPQLTADFFDAHWMFGSELKNGFDIVIGNPPYVQVKKGLFSKDQFPWSEGKDIGKQNLYKVFLEAAYNTSRQHGVSCLIVQSSLMADLSSARTREMLLTKTRLKKIIEFPKKAPSSEGQVFESVLQGTCICVFQKKPTPENHFLISCNNDITTIMFPRYEKVCQRDLIRFRPKSFEFPLFQPGDEAVYRKIFSISLPLGKMTKSITQGDLNLTTNADSFYQTETPTKLYRGRNIRRYCLNECVTEWVKPGHFEDRINQNKEEILLVCQEITGTVDPRRLIFTQIKKPESRFLFGHTVQKIILINQQSSRYVLALLNSKLMDWIFRKTSTNNHVGGYELQALPFPATIPKKTEEVISLLVSKILKAKEINPENDTHALEREIDSQIYVLYGLTAQETVIVEGTVHNAGLGNTSSDPNDEEVGPINEDPIINAAPSFDVRAYDKELDCKKKKERKSHLAKEDSSLRIDETEQNDVLCTIRQMFSEGLELTREEAFRKIAKELGYDRVGSKIEEILDSDIRTAVKRGILENERGTLKILCKTIEGYEREFLKDQFLASIGRPWVEREEAVRAFTRFMGFRRAGEKIQDTVRSLINGLLREDRLESDGQLIRRKS